MAGYNCNNSINNAYGEGAFGTCDTQSVGAPNTGVFQEIMGGASFTIIAPLAAAIAVVVIATFIMKLRKRKESTDASL